MTQDVTVSIVVGMSDHQISGTGPNWEGRWIVIKDGRWRKPWGELLLWYYFSFNVRCVICTWVLVSFPRWSDAIILCCHLVVFRLCMHLVRAYNSICVYYFFFCSWLNHTLMRSFLRRRQGETSMSELPSWAQPSTMSLHKWRTMASPTLTTPLS